ncbi:MAG: hypothetical protein QGI88_01950 [SAR202 cluster bacterium]|nr:hypothetical protein [SAR202 cluster bacterium]|tara:strand:+ start:2120 stop:3286 length:1167 start_codon:yes stop_codon:yes gene_type:complete
MELSSDFRQTLERGMDRLAWGAEAVAKTIPPVQEGRYLNLNFNNGTYVVEEQLGYWAGYLAGKLWMLYDYYGTENFAQAASLVTRWCGPIMKEANVNTGFVTQYAPTLGYELTGEEWLKELALEGCESFAKTYNPELGIFMMWPPTEPKPEHYGPFGRNFADWETFIDESSCGSPLWWARRFKPEYGDMMVSHQEGMSSLGVIQPDGRSHHMLGLDPATKKPLGFHTMQGYDNTTHWTRSQGWAMNSSIFAFEATGDEQFLEIAIKVSDYYLNDMIKDGPSVPFYDVLDPRIPDVPRDTCSVALATNCMIRLIEEKPELQEKYGAYIEAGLTELFDNHVTPAGTLLHGSWGNIRGLTESVMPYGGLYLTEAVYRLLKAGKDIWGTRPA